MKGKAKWLQALAIAVLLLLGTTTAIACNGPRDDGESFESPVIGMYYNDDAGAEWLLSLNADKTYALNIGNDVMAGTYDVNGNDISFAVSNASLGETAVYADNAVTVKYNDADIVFLRRVDYTVKFDTGAGSAVADVQVRNGKSVQKPADPEYAGHVFIGWYKDKEYKTPFKFGADAIRADVTLYARYVEKTVRDEYIVEFDLGYGESSAYQTVKTVGGFVYNIEDPVRAGYDFKGWWTKTDAAYSQRVELDGYEFIEDVELYALWASAPTDGKLAAPVVNIEGNRISWDRVPDAGRYMVKITDPDGEVKQTPENGTSVTYEFTKAGKYAVEVYAVSLASDDKNSETTIREYVNKRLARASALSVDGDVLTFSKVENAAEYYVYYTCGDPMHKHDPISNGKSTEYNFGDCVMVEGGLKFTVEARAAGYIASTSREYTVDRTLDAADGFKYDADANTVSWNAVENATSYTVTVVCSDDGHKVTETVKNRTSIDLSECAKGDIKVTVVANNAKYNSSTADFSCVKSESRAPADVKIDNMLLSWEDLGANEYTVDINGTEYKATANSLDLSALSVAWTAGGEYAIKVRAVKGSDISSWSAVLNGVYRAIDGLEYENGKVFWKPVIGVAGITVTVNDGDGVKADNSSADITLTDRVNTVVVSMDGISGGSKTLTVNAHKITFDGNGGVDAPDDAYYANGDTLEFGAAERNGYDFIGWYGAATGNGKHYASGSEFTADDDVTLYARWTGKWYDVTLNYNRTGDDNDEVKTVRVQYGEPFDFGVPSELKSPIYGFMQWNLNRDGSGTVLAGSDGMSVNVWSFAGNGMTVYAVWDTVFKFEKVDTGSEIYYIVRKGDATNKVTELSVPAEFKADGENRAYPVKVVGGNAFSSCGSLTKVTIPASVDTIEPTAFSYCNNLLEITIDGGRPGITTYWSDGGVLYGINGNTGRAEIVYYPLGKTGDYTISSGITDIGYQSLKGAHIDTLYIPATVNRVSNNAFESSDISAIVFQEPEAGATPMTLNILSSAFRNAYNVTSVTFPSREFKFVDDAGEPLDAIDFKADLFASCRSLSAVYVNEGNTKYLSVDGMLCERDANGSDVTVIFCPVAYDFDNGKYETSAKITAIGDKAFSGLKTLREVVIGTSITRIGEHAFSGYTVRVGDRTVNISACEALVSVKITGSPAGLTIGKAAFGTELESSSISTAGGNVRMACDALSTLEFTDDSNVTDIGDYAFSFSRIFSFKLPRTLTHLGTGAFKNCTQLIRVEISENDTDLTFGEDVFKNCTRLERVVLPKNITEFKGGVFAGCSSLRIIEVDPENPVLTFIDGILYGKDAETGKVTSIHFIPVGVDMTNYTLPDGITEINAGVFGNAGDSIKELTISKYVTYIGEDAFAKTGIERVIFLNKENDNDDGADTLYIAPSKNYNGGLFYNCTKLKEVVLPARLTSIPAGMFSGCSALTAIDLSGIAEIGKYAFYNSGLTGELIIPKNVNILGMQAFYSCKKLTKVTFEDDRTEPLFLWNGNEVTDGLDGDNNFVARGYNVSGNTFNGCSELTEVHLPEKLVNLSAGMFSSCSKLTTVNIPSTVQSIRYDTFSGCSKLANLTFAARPDANELYIEDGSTSTGGGQPTYYGAFMSLTAKNVVFPKGLVRVPSYCFYNNKNITSVYIPNTVRNLVNEEGKTAVLAIGSSAFNSCTSLTTVTFEADNPADLADEDYKGFSSASAFTGCSKLTSITLPARLSDYYSNKTLTAAYSAFTGGNFTSISVMDGNDKYSSDNGMLYNADKTEIILCPREKTGAVSIPYAVTSVAKDAFKGCTKVTSLTFEAKPQTETVAEGEEEKKDDLVLGDSAFYGCSGIAGELILPARVTEIGASAFTNCSKITKLTFENGSRLTNIGASAFYGCTELGAKDGTLSIPASVVTIGEKAFSAGNGLTKVTALNFASDSESKLTTIGANAFEKIGIQSVYLPDSVTTLGNNVFANSLNLTEASVPLTVDNFNGTFLNCANLTTLNFREVEGKEPALDKTSDGAVYSKDGTVLYYYPQDAVPNAGTEKAGELEIKSGVEEIAATAFAYNPNITKITIPNTVTKIGMQAFYFMTALREVVFEEDTVSQAATETSPAIDGTDKTSLVFDDGGTSSTSYGKTFAGCGNLTKINFPTRLTTLSKYCFNYCTSLSDISFAENCKLSALPNYAFQYTGNLGDVVLPDNLGRLGQYTFRYSGIRSVVIPASYVYNSSDSYTFADCANLTSVEFKTPEKARSSMQTTGNMFSNCVNLASVTLPNDITVIGSSSFMGCTSLAEMTLPETVVTINSSAFNGCANLASINRKEGDAAGTVNLPVKVKSIGGNAFYNCSKITKINLDGNTASSLSISAAAFAGTSITEFTFPNTVGSLYAVFSDSKATCEKLETVVFESGNTKLKSIPAGMFKNMSNLKNVTLPTGLTGTNKLTIGNNAFSGTSITSIVIPKETEKIDYSAFANCKNLTSVTFEKDGSGNCALKWLGNYVFQYSGITSIVIPKSASLGTSSTSYSSNCFDGCVDLVSVEFEAGSVITGFGKDKSASSYHFRDCTSLTSVVLPSNLQQMGKYLFYGCTALQSIELPSSLRDIPEYAFYGCAALKRVTFKNNSSNVTEICNYAFKNSGLTAFTAPVMLGSIGKEAFRNCANLATFAYAGTSVSSIGAQAFDGCKKLNAIVIPDGVITIGDFAYQNCDAATSVTLPVSLMTLGVNPFINCDNLTAINAPAYVEGDTVRFTVDGGALYNGDKTKLYLFFDRTATEFTLPEETTEIANSAFWYMPLTTVVATNEGLVIGANAFRGSAVSSVTLGARVEIGETAFAYCENLAEITLPDGAKVFMEAFLNCPKLASIIFEGAVTYEDYSVTLGADATLTISGIDGIIDEDAFWGDEFITKVVIAEGVTEIGESAFYGAVNLTSVTFPSTLVTIGDYAFRNTGLTGKITVPASVKTIGDMAFAQDYGITEIELNGGLESIGDNAFAGTAITSITIPNTVTTLGEAVFFWRNSTTNINYVCDKLETISFDANNTGLKTLAEGVFRCLPALTSVTLPDHLETISKYAFYGHTSSLSSSEFIGTSISSISIPATVKTISDYAFDKVASLKSVTFERDENGESALTTIGSNAFRDTGLVGKLSIPRNVVTIGSNAFYGCSGITEIEFERKVAPSSPETPEGEENEPSVASDEPELAIQTINTGAFAGTSITAVTIPETVGTLGNSSSGNVGVFEGCASLAAVTFGYDKNRASALKTVGWATFGGTAVTEVEFPATVTKMGAAFIGCTQIRKVVLPCITDTGFAASLLAELPSLTEVVIPEGVTTINAETFKNCTGITKLVLPSSILKFFGKVFYGWTSEQTICLTGMKAPRSGFELNWAEGCNANLVWNYSETVEPVVAD